jgi:hypothetical protein
MMMPRRRSRVSAIALFKQSMEYKMIRCTRLFKIGILLLGLGALTACLSPHARVERHEDNLAAAGFIVRPANTPERQAMLKRLPANRFIRRTDGDTVDYVYSDPLVCGCLYVGTQQAYG